MAPFVYLLCALSSFSCAYLLFRSQRATRNRLVLYTTLSFAGLTINNLLLFTDYILMPNIDLSFLRLLTMLVSVAGLGFGLIWDAI